MNSLKALCAAAALTITPACDSPKPQAQTSTTISDECRTFRAMIAADLLLDNLRADPNGKRRLLGLDKAMAKESNQRVIVAMETLQEKGEDPIECAKASEEE